MIQEMKKSKTKIKRSIPSEGIRVKERFVVLQNDNKIALSTRKLILISKDDNACNNLGYKMIKTYKEHNLYEVIYSITLSTLAEVIDWIDSLFQEQKKG
jgi:hypothetical protein